jgi:hypothetical protein
MFLKTIDLLNMQNLPFSQLGDIKELKFDGRIKVESL